MHPHVHAGKYQKDHLRLSVSYWDPANANQSGAKYISSNSGACSHRAKEDREGSTDNACNAGIPEYALQGHRYCTHALRVHCMRFAKVTLQRCRAFYISAQAQSYHEAVPIRVYRTGHTIAKAFPGGFQLGCLKC